MRKLILLRGLPASGKSTFIEDNRLQDYTISSDVVRKMVAGITVDIGTGEPKIAQNNEEAVWGVIGSIMEERFKRGQFTVLDATNLKESNIREWRDLARKYRYEVYVYTLNTSKDVCITRDSNREKIKRVGEGVIERMSKVLESSRIPDYIVEIPKGEIKEYTQAKVENLNGYKKINLVGEIEGCYHVLQEYLKGELRKDEFYIFMGGYISPEGENNKKVLESLKAIKDLENVVLIEGVTEKLLVDYCLGVEIDDGWGLSVRELKETGKYEIEKFLWKMKEVYIFEYRGTKYMVNHGGVVAGYKEAHKVSAREFIQGHGCKGDAIKLEESYKDEVYRYTSIYRSPDMAIQIHAYKTQYGCKAETKKYVYNLNSNPSKGGYLVIQEISDKGIEIKQVENKNQVIDTKANIRGYMSLTKGGYEKYQRLNKAYKDGGKEKLVESVEKPEDIAFYYTTQKELNKRVHEMYSYIRGNKNISIKELEGAKKEFTKDYYTQDRIEITNGVLGVREIVEFKIPLDIVLKGGIIEIEDVVER